MPAFGLYLRLDDFFADDFFAADFFAADFFAGAFFAVDFLIDDFFAADFLVADFVVAFLLAFLVAIWVKPPVWLEGMRANCVASGRVKECAVCAG
ncbi:MAG: hypothetical protein WBY53_04780 [Acidobacteriaceae bacterium]